MIRLIKRTGASVAPHAPRVEVKPIELVQVGASITSPVIGQFGLDDPVPRARQEAEIIIRTARSEADSIREQARTEGWQAACADVAGQADVLIRRLESALDEMAAQRNSLIDDVEPQMLKLCIQAVEKVIRHEIRTDPRVVERAIKACMRRVKDSNELCLRVSPEELDSVRELRDELLKAADGVRNVQVVNDRRVEPGGCVVESVSGCFDARIETQLNRLQDKLMEAFDNGREADPGPDQIQRDDTQHRHDQS